MLSYVVNRFLFSECCASQDILPKCRPLCDYNVSFSDFEVELLLECEKDIAKVLMCGAGGYIDNNVPGFLFCFVFIQA